MKTPRITAKDLGLYGMLALPVAFAGFPLYVLAPDYYATHHGLSLTLLGTMLLAIRLFDAVQDPVIGWVADRWRNKYFPFMIGAGLILCGAVYALFNLTLFNPALWFALCLMLAVSAYSVLTVLLGAYAILWTDDKNDQTRIVGARESLGLVGLVIAVSLPAALTHIAPTEQVFRWYGGILLLFMIIALAGFSRLPRYHGAAPREQVGKTRILSGLYAIPPATKRLLLIYALSMLASSIPAVLVIFYVRDLLQAEQMTGLFLLAYFLSGAIGMPVWKYLSRRLGKYQAWALSNIIAVAGFIGAFFLGAGDIAAYGMVCIISGFALGADLTLPPSILADNVHATDSSRFSATYFALLAFLSKASLALASAIALPTLDMMGFKPQGANDETALFALSASYALIPCALKLGAAGLLYMLFIRFQPGGSHENHQNHRNNRSSDYV